MILISSGMVGLFMKVIVLVIVGALINSIVLGIGGRGPNSINVGIGGNGQNSIGGILGKLIPISPLITLGNSKLMLISAGVISVIFGMTKIKLKLISILGMTIDIIERLKSKLLKEILQNTLSEDKSKHESTNGA